ncbi:MAG: hypothetical protein ACK439_08140 [Novosphingobium sp.]|jgi:hypothetical protein
MKQLLNRVLRKLREIQFLRACRAVLNTAPCQVDPEDRVIIFSMIGTKVLLPYLVAAKSFQSRLGLGRFAILDDGTLTAADKAVLAHHLGNPPITPIASVETGPCPLGGTWERLLTILDLRRDNYVIQLDSDIVVLGDVPDVLSAIATGTSFTLRGEAGAEFLPLAGMSDWARRQAGSGPLHVQSSIELAMEQVRIAGRDGLDSVRGCSGFAGFAPSGEGRGLAEAFSQEAERLLGAARWAEWGSEQVTSNFIVANEPRRHLLPYDRYLNFWNEPLTDSAAVVHFIGTFRYHRGAYLRAARQAIAHLNG